MATYEVKGIFSICLILCVLEGSYFLLFWHNKQIIFTWNEIIYRSIFGIEKKYSWEDVKTVCYKSIGRGSSARKCWSCWAAPPKGDAQSAETFRVVGRDGTDS